MPSSSIDINLFEVAKIIPWPHQMTVTAIALSPNARYFVLGDAAGHIEVRETLTGGTIRRIEVQFSVKAIIWIYSSGKQFVLIGDSKGYVNVVRLEIMTSTLVIKLKHESSINYMVVNEDGDLAVAYGYDVRLYHGLFNDLDKGTFVSDHKSHTYQRPSQPRTGFGALIGNPLALGIHFLPDGTLLVMYIHGIGFFSTVPPYSTIDFIRATVPELVGASAISPSKKTVIVTNLYNGADWFSIPTRSFTSTYTYLSMAPFSRDFPNKILGVSFLNEEVAVLGHYDPQIYLVHSKTNGPLTSHRVIIPGLPSQCITRTIATGNLDGEPVILAVSGEGEKCIVAVIRQVKPFGLKSLVSCRTLFLIGLCVMLGLLGLGIWHPHTDIFNQLSSAANQLSSFVQDGYDFNPTVSTTTKPTPVARTLAMKAPATISVDSLPPTTPVAGIVNALKPPPAVRPLAPATISVDSLPVTTQPVVGLINALKTPPAVRPLLHDVEPKQVMASGAVLEVVSGGVLSVDRETCPNIYM